MRQVFEDHFVDWLQKRNITKKHLKKKVTVQYEGKKLDIPLFYKFLIEELIVDPNGEDLEYGAKMGKPYFEIREGDGETEPHFLLVDWSKLDRSKPGSKITLFAVNLLKPTGSDVLDKVNALKHSNVVNGSIEKYEKKLAKFSADVTGIPVVITKKSLFSFLF